MKHKPKTIAEIKFPQIQHTNRISNFKRELIRLINRSLLPKGSIVIIPDGRAGRIIGWCGIENEVRIRNQRRFEFYKKSELTVIKRTAL